MPRKRGNTSNSAPFLVDQAHACRHADGRGNWIPSTSLDQYAATLGSWFGVSNADLLQIFPNLAIFSPQKLGFA